jgi:hypothetical protein
MVTLSGSRAELAARPATRRSVRAGFSAWVQASASTFEVDRGWRPGRHQRWTKAPVISPWHGRALHDIAFVALLGIRIKDRLTGRAPAQLGHLGESAILHKSSR